MNEITVLSDLRTLVTWLKEVKVYQSPHTHRAYQDGWKMYLDYKKENPDATLLDYRQYLTDKYPAKQSVNLRLSALRAFYAWQVERGLIEYAPVIRVIKKAKNTPHKKEPLTNDEVRRLLSTCDNSPIGIRDHCIMSLMLYSGLRIVECQRADTEDIKTQAGRMTIWVQGKGRSEKDEFNVIPVHQENIIRAWLNIRNGNKNKALFVDMREDNGDRVTSRTITRAVYNRMIAAGIIERKPEHGMKGTKTVHSLRHTALTNATDNEAQLLQVQTMARHSNPATSLIYIKSRDRMKAPAEDLIDYND